MPEYKPFEFSRVWISGDFIAAGFEPDGTSLRFAVVREGLSRLTETEIMVFSETEDVDLSKLVGRRTCIHLKTEGDKERMFSGICISAEYSGFKSGHHVYIMHLRPWLWLLTLAEDCRIFQQKSAVEIIKDVLKQHGFSDIDDKLKDTYEKRDYCVQYRETDYAFLCRLMEEEGIYFRFSNADGSTTAEDLVLCDGISAHDTIPGHPDVGFHRLGEAPIDYEDHVSDWARVDNLTTGKVSLTDFDFMAPTADMLFDDIEKPANHEHGDFEVYGTPGHHRIPDDFSASKKRGERLARAQLQSKTLQRETYRGTATVRAVASGHLLNLTEHEHPNFNTEYLVTSATHFIQDANQISDKNPLDFSPFSTPPPEDSRKLAYFNELTAIPSKVEYRAPRTTPWPEIAGLHTATVVGKKGEEIWTDDQGRIKVQFHWDRVGTDDENSSCWVRVVTQWSGNGWGMVALPRMGQEVVIQFEEGDPDRPICTGMLYNNDRKATYDFPDKPTQLGIRTRSSKNGKEDQYNELMFDDLSGKELMRVQAQKDHQELIKDRSVVTIGLDKHELADNDGEISSEVEAGSLSEVIKQNVTRFIQKGNHEFTVEKGDEKLVIGTGSQTLDIKKDKTQTIEGKHTKTITGNDSTTLKSGNMSVDVKSGKITMKAMQSIELKVGGSSIKLEPTKITIKSVMIDIKGQAKADLSAPMTNVKASGILVLNGSLTKIN